MASGVSQPPKAGRSADGRVLTCEQFIEGQLRKTSQGVKAVDLAFSLMLLLIASLGFFGLMAVLDHWVVPGGLATWARASFFVLFIGGAIAYVVLRVVPVMVGRINPVYAAYTIEHSAPALKNSLLNFLLFRNRQRGEVPEPVYQALEQQAAAKLSTVPVEIAVDRSQILRLGYVLMALAVVCALYKVFSPKDPIVTAQRVMLPWADILPPSRVKIEELKPGTTAAVRGEGVPVSARIRGLGAQEEARLIYTTDDGQAVDRALPMLAADGGEVFTCMLPESEAGLQEGLVYRVEAGDAVSHQHRIDVITAPTMALKTVAMQFPGYTKLLERRYVRDGNLRAIEGTRVTLRVETNSEIKTAWVDFGNDKRRDLEMTHSGTGAWVTFPLELDEKTRTAKHSSYSLRFTNVEGRSNHDPVEYRIEVMPDIAPEISFLQPEPSERETEVPLDGTLTIEVSAIDPDFALSRVELRGKVGTREVFIHRLLEKAQSGQFVTKYELSPSKEKLKAGDLVEYWAETLDNKTPKPNSSSTEPYYFKVIAPEQPPEQVAQNNPRQQPDQDPQPKQDPQGADEPMPGEQPENQDPDKQNPDQQPDKKKPAPDKKNPEQQNTDESMPSEDEASKDEESQNEQNENGESKPGEQGKQGGQKQAGNGSGKPDPKQKSPEKSKQKPQPGDQGQGGDTGEEGNSEGSEDAPEDGEERTGKAQGGKKTGKKSEAKPDGSNEPSEGDMNESQPGEDSGEPGASGQQSGKPSDRSEAAGDQGQQAESVARDDEGTVFDRIKKTLEKKQQEQANNPEKSPGAKPDPSQKQVAKNEQSRSEQGTGEDQPMTGERPQGQQPDGQQPKQQPAGSEPMGEQAQPPGEHPTDADDTGASTGEDQQTGEKPTGEANEQRKKSPENGESKDPSSDDPLFGEEEEKQAKPEQNAGASGKKQTPEKKPAAGEEQGTGASEKAEPMPGENTGKQTGEGQKPAGDESAEGKQPGKQPGTEKSKEAGKKPGDQPKEATGEKTAPSANTKPEGSGGAEGESEEGQKPTPDSQGTPKPKDKGTKPGQKSEKPSDDAKSPGHGKAQSDAEGEQDGDREGGGKPGGGEDSDQAGQGSAGKNTPSDTGAGAADEPGMGDTSSNGGDKDLESKQQPKTAGDTKAGEGRTKKPGDQGQGKPKQPGESGGDNSQPTGNDDPTPGFDDKSKKKAADYNKPEKLSDDKSKSATDETQKQDNPAGAKNNPDQKSDESQTPGSNPGEPGPGQEGNAPPTDGEGQPVGGEGQRTGKAAPPKQGEAPGADEANLEYTRQATDLVLDYLENQLQQDELSREVQEQLPGWSKEDIQQLVDRARTRQQAAKGQGAESEQAKKELADWLRSLGLKKNTGRGVTQQAGEKQDKVEGLRQTRGSKAPAEYADQVEAYKKGLSREQK